MNLKAVLGWPLPAKIIVGVVALAVILNLISRYNNYSYQKNIEANTTPHKQTMDITKVPQQVKAFLSDENLQKMDGAGMNIYTGNNPPKIEGDYDFKHIVTKYDQEGANLTMVPYRWQFKDQKDDNTVSISYQSQGLGKKEDLGEGKGVFISGEGNCFSVYIDNSSSIGKCQSKSADIFSACKSEKGLVDMDMGFIMTYVGDQCTSEDDLMPEGNFRIVTQKTLAPKIK